MAVQDDPHDLARFVAAQDSVWESVMAELRAGAKRSHWMWFVFPQIEGLSRSPTGRRYAIRSRAEAEAFLAHPVLGPRVREAALTLLAHRGASARAILGSPDDLKLRSSMTLFANVADDPSPFEAVLSAFFDGPCHATRAWLERA